MKKKLVPIMMTLRFFIPTQAFAAKEDSSFISYPPSSIMYDSIPISGEIKYKIC
ncbi:MULTISPECIES: hypothetical protein [Priestia]|uniref:hypothetical protein n=1 Tax=Priestia TaxID=2800373 RepID=UPI00190917BF|nr:hypothetical protein [Bacillus sp. S35]